MIKTLATMMVFFAIGSTAYAQEQAPCLHGGQKIEQPMGMGMLDLSAEQKQAMHMARMDAEKKIIQLRADIEMKNIDLKHEMMMDKPNRDKIMKLLKDINDLELKIKQAQMDEKLKMHSLLTSEQREKMMEQMPMHKCMKHMMPGAEKSMH